MAAFLTYLHQYVPCITYTESKGYIQQWGNKSIERAKIHSILFGRDQLTARHSIKAKINSQTPAKQLTGIIPVIEDWHTKAKVHGVSCIRNPVLPFYLVLHVVQSWGANFLSYAIQIFVTSLFCSV